MSGIMVSGVQQEDDPPTPEVHHTRSASEMMQKIQFEHTGADQPDMTGTSEAPFHTSRTF